MGGKLRGWRRLLRAGVMLSVLVGLTFAAGAASADPPDDFIDETLVLGGLDAPTNVEFAPDGKVFVAEKRGTIQVYDSINDSSPTLFADLRPDVNDYWDRGLLGLAVHPEFPTEPYVYALYTYAVPLDASMPTWSGSACPDPPGGTDDGCVVSGRLVRLTATGNQSTAEVELIRDWCQQYPSHSIGDLVFGDDGALYVSAGDGASFNFVDFGQGGGDPDSQTPENPCGDPPVPVGGDQQQPTAEGGALRSQDLRTSGDPVTLDGTVIRIDPMTGDPLPDNPAFGAADENKERIVAYGLRNPFRMALQPGTGDLYIGDVGWNHWEEVNVLPSSGGVLNFGWPCYEGGNGVSLKQSGYDLNNLNICEALYADVGAVTPSLFAYHHDLDVTGNDECPPAPPPQPTSSSIAGLAFYESGDYPGVYKGALFGLDYSRRCIWVMYPDENGNPDPSTVEVFYDSASSPVELEIGPGGDIYYVELIGDRIHRLRFVGDNTPPLAHIAADPISGQAPLAVEFDASDSSDPDGDDIVSYEWDLDNDDAFDDATGVTTSEVYGPGSHTVRLRVTDSRGESDVDTITILASNTAPTPNIDSPLASETWEVGSTISFSGSATDPEEGTLPPSALTWQVTLHHCATLTSCHQHPLHTFVGVSSGSFAAPDHEYPSYLELKLTAEDQYEVQSTTSIEPHPDLVDLTFATTPAGLQVMFNGETKASPFTETWIVGATVEISTETTQQSAGWDWAFQSWSDGHNRTHSFPAPSSDTTYTATFDAIPRIVTQLNHTHPENELQVVDVDSVDPDESEGSGLVYSLTGGADRPLFTISPATGSLKFVAPPDFENPRDSNGDNIYLVEVTVADSLGLTDSKLFTVEVTDANDPINNPPVANAGSDRTVTVGNTAQLDGTGSKDPDGESLTYAWSIASQPTGSTATLVGLGTATPKLTPDLAGTYTIQLEVSDGTATDTDQVKVFASDVQSSNLPPRIMSNGGGTKATITVDEGVKTVTDVQSTDPDGDTEGNGLTYSLTAGVDRERFQISPSGMLTFKTAPDFESPTDANKDNTYIVVVQVEDSGGLTDKQEIRVAIRDVTESAAGIFIDDDNSIFEASIEWMAAKGITRGCNPPENDRFCPDDFVSRGQMAAFFARAFGWTDDGGGNLFVDDNDSSFEHDIDLMGAAGVTKGCNPPENDRFCPDDFVTRGQMAAFFERAWKAESLP